MAKSKLLAKKAAEPGELPGYGQNENPVKDVAERMGVPYVEGYPNVNDVTCTNIIMEIPGFTAENEGIALEGIRLSINGIDDQIELLLTAAVAKEICAKLQPAIAKCREVATELKNDPTVLHESEV